jgi:predicted flap endonuclease-1-like 5' DNA nuclease
MPYTLVKGLVWVVLALLLGAVIGWLLRSLRSRRQIARARAAALAATGGDAATADATELQRLRLRLAAIESVRPMPGAGDQAPGSGPTAGHYFALERPPTPDVAAAAAVLGREIELDDLRVVVGVGPAIESLCRRIGIRTWWDLATTETSLLRAMLIDARPGLAVDDSASWPIQARLLAEGRWVEFKALTDELAAGRPSD